MDKFFEIKMTRLFSFEKVPNFCIFQPPKKEKQFLISPPPSPPEGWVQIIEDKPNSLQPGLASELISRLAALKTGESHEIVEQSEKHPSIILFACEVNYY
jgi:calcipressin-1